MKSQSSDVELVCVSRERNEQVDELVSRCQDGDEDAWRDLIARFRAMMISCCVRRAFRAGFSPGEAWSVAYETLVTTVAKYRPGERYNFAPLLHARLSVSDCMPEAHGPIRVPLRATDKSRNTAHAQAWAALNSQSVMIKEPLCPDQPESDDRLEILHEAIDCLSPANRDAMQLFVRGHSPTQICELLGINMGAYDTRKKKSLDRLTEEAIRIVARNRHRARRRRIEAGIMQ